MELRCLFIGFVLLAACNAGATGDPCSETADCEAGRCEIGGSFPEGVCTTACSANADCPDGFSCISRSSGICLRNCTDDATCEGERGEAWQCREESLEDGGGNQRVCIGD